jgi:hypothetical protein
MLACFAGSPTADTIASLSALATTLTTVTASLGSVLDGSAPPVDMGKLLAGMAAAMDSGVGGEGGVTARAEHQKDVPL